MFILVMLAVFGAVVCNEQLITQIVATKQGKVEGSLSASGLYYQFMGIRYGVPVKFRAPRDPPSFKGVFKADEKSIFCAQFPSNDLFAAPSENEDCLSLNIFTPTTYLTNTSMPVMVYLHGGDFGVGSGSPSFYGPQYLVNSGVVVVTLNYRLNVYGYLNLGIEEAPGNAGLKDIRAALRWLRENIGNFGGDPDNVTVFGHGAGGTAALYLTMSPTTRGLFKRVISQSGTVFSPKSFDAQPLKTASQVAKSLGVNTKKPLELFKLYKDAPIVKVEEAISKQLNAKSIFVPSVENVFDDEEAFLTDTPYNILATGSDHESFNPVPIIIGLNTVEGLTSTLEYNTITSQIDRIKHDDLSALDQRSFHVPKTEITEFRQMLRDAYFSNGTESDENIVGGIINLNSDFHCVGPMSLFVEMLTNRSEVPVYQYIFNYIGYRNLGRLLTNTTLPATTNLDELLYVYELNRMSMPMIESDAKIVGFMTTMWTNFAKFGKPTPDPGNGAWLPHPHQLAITLEPQYVAPLTPDRAYFFKTLYQKYGSEITRPQHDI